MLGFLDLPLNARLRTRFACFVSVCAKDVGIALKMPTMLDRRGGKAPRDRLAGVGLKPPRAAKVKSLGGERRGKGKDELCEVRIKETSESELLKTCRKKQRRCQNQKDGLFWDEVERSLLTAQSASGIKVV